MNWCYFVLEWNYPKWWSSFHFHIPCQDQLFCNSIPCSKTKTVSISTVNLDLCYFSLILKTITLSTFVFVATRPSTKIKQLTFVSIFDCTWHIFTMTASVWIDVLHFSGLFSHTFSFTSVENFSSKKITKMMLVYQRVHNRL